MAKSTENYSIRRMVSFIGTHTYSFLHFESAKGYDDEGHYSYTATMKGKDAEGNITEGKKVGITTIFNKDKFYVIVDSTNGLTIDEVKKLNAFGETLKRNLKGHQQDGRDFEMVFENDNVVEKDGTMSIVARKATKASLKGEALSERKAQAKSDEEKAADAIAKQEAKTAKMKALFAETYGKKPAAAAK